MIPQKPRIELVSVVAFVAGEKGKRARGNVKSVWAGGARVVRPRWCRLATLNGQLALRAREGLGRQMSDAAAARQVGNATESMRGSSKYAVPCREAGSRRALMDKKNVGLSGRAHNNYWRGGATSQCVAWYALPKSRSFWQHAS